MSLNNITQKDSNSASFLRLLSFFEPEAIPILDGWQREDHCDLSSNESRLRSFLRHPSGITNKAFAARKKTKEPFLEVLNGLHDTTKSRGKAETAVGNLRDLSLVRCKNRVLWMHDLTRHFVRKSIPESEHDSWVHAAIEIIYHTFPIHDSTSQERAMVDLFLPQAATIIKLAQDAHVKIECYAKLLSMCANCYQNRGMYDQALKWYRQALPVFEKVLGSNNNRTIALLHHIGWTYRQIGNMEQCEKFHRRTLEARERVFGKDSRETLESINDLASCIERQGKLKVAEEYFMLCYTRQNEVYGIQNEATQACAHNLALCYANQGRLEKAIVLYRETLAAASPTPNGKSDGALKTLSNLTVALDHQGHLAEAEKLYEESLNEFKEVFGYNDLITLRVRSNLSGLYRLVRRFNEAEALIREVLEQYICILGEDHFHSLIAMYDVGEVLHKKGNLHKADNYYQYSVDIMEAKSPDHPLLFRTSDALRILKREMGDLASARVATEKAFQSNQKLLGWDDPYTLVTANNEAELLHAEGKHEAAKRLYYKCLRSLKGLLGHKHPHVAMVENNMGRLARDCGNTYEAEAHFGNALQIFQSVLGDSHPCLLTVSLNISRLRLSEGSFREACSRIREVRNKFRAVVGEYHPYVCLSNCFLGVALAALGHGSIQEALKCLQESVEGYSKTLGPEHTNTIYAMCMLVRVLTLNGDIDDASAMASVIESASISGHLPKSNPRAVVSWQRLISTEHRMDDWKVGLPLQWGETTRVRWGRKCVWREFEKEALSG